MRYPSKRDPICAWYGLKDLPDPDCECPLCGEPIWPDEAVDFDQNNKICHAACVEKEEARHG